MLYVASTSEPFYHDKVYMSTSIHTLVFFFQSLSNVYGHNFSLGYQKTVVRKLFKLKCS